MGRVEWILLFALAAIWGGSFFLYKVLVEHLPPLTVVLGRVSFAAIALLAIVYLSGLRMPTSPRAWGAFFVMGALNNVIPFTLIAWGETRIASGLAAILNATTPLFTILLAHVLTREERLTAKKIVGALFCLLGVIVLIGPSAVHRLSLGSIAQLAVLGAAASYGFAGIYGRRFKDTSPLVTAAGQFSASALLTIPLALAADRPWRLAAPSWETWSAMLALALLCTAIAYVMYFRILAAAGATNVSLVTFLVPIGALLLGINFLGERLTASDIAGMLLIFAGLAAIDGRALALLGRLRESRERRAV
ncbi:DMT family transporter [bacterium]|nr:MAG: DMT family transporter [bacterium]